MPRYRITAPDGRTITVEGQKAPTEQDISAIFGQVAQPAQPDPYSALDKAQYIGRAAAEGATFGLGDLVAGKTNVLANDVADIQNAQDWKARGKGVKNLLMHTFIPGTELFDKDFSQGRNDFIAEQQDFAKAHPALNFAGEMGGGLVTGIAGAGKKLATTAGKQGLKALAGEGAREGAKFGATYGAGSGLTEEQDRLSVANALKGAGAGLAGGAVLGAALPVGIAGAVKGAKALGRGVRKIGQILDADMVGTPLPKAPVKQAPQVYVDEFGEIQTPKALQRLLEIDEKAVQQAAKDNVPLIDIAGKKMMGTASGVRLVSPEAEQILADYSEKRIAGQHPKIVNTLRKFFGDKGSHQLLAELNEDVQKGSKALYDKAIYQVDKAGNILLDNAGRPVSKVLPELEKLNKYELDYVGKVYGTKGLEYEVSGLPQNDMRILNYAKQLMDDDIQRLINQGHNNQARILAEKRADFIAKIDKANPEYKTARAFFERGKRAEDALNAGKKALAGERSNLMYDFNQLTPEEQAFYRKGVGNRLEELTNSQAKEGNIAHRVFGEETLRRLKELGIKDIDELEKFVRGEQKAHSNLTQLLKGSQTAEREQQADRELGLSVGKALVSPKRTIKQGIAKSIDKTIKQIMKDTSEQDRIEIARLLTDPDYLAKQVNEINRIKNMRTANLARIRAGQPVQNSVKQAMQAEKPSGSITDYLANKIKEEGGFFDSPLVSYLSDADKPIATITGKEIAGLGKDVRSSKPIILDWFRKNISTQKSNREGIGDIFYPMSSVREVVGRTNDLEKIKLLPAVKNVVDNGKILNNGKLKVEQGRPDNIAGFYFIQGKVNVNGKPKVMQVDIAQDNLGRKFYFYSEIKNDPDLGALTSTRSVSGSTNSIAQKGQNVKGVKQILNSEGNPVATTEEGTKNFGKFFKGASHQVKNSKGEPIVFYHSTPNAGFEEFNPLSHFTPNKAYSQRYLDQGASSMGYKQTANNPDTYAVYLNMKKPFDTRDPKARDIFKKEYQAYYSPELTEKGLVGWMEVEDLAEWLQTKHPEYDGIIADEGGVGGYGQEVIDRGLTYVPFKPTQIKSVKNSGKFDPKNPNIYKSLIGGLGISQILRNKENK